MSLSQLAILRHIIMFCRADRAERQKLAKEKAEKERLDKEKEKQQMHDRQERARILKESALLAQDAVNQHFSESLRRVSSANLSSLLFKFSCKPEVYYCPRHRLVAFTKYLCNLASQGAYSHTSPYFSLKYWGGAIALLSTTAANAT